MSTDAAEPLRGLLAAVDAGELTADSGLERGILARLEGALAAVDAGAAALAPADRQAATKTLEAVLAAVEAGTLTAPAGFARRLEGAVKALRGYDPAGG